MCAQAQRPTREPHEVQFPQFSGDRKKDNNKLMSFKASLSRWPGPLLTPPSVVRQPKQGKEKEATYRHPSFIVDHQAIVEPLFTKLYICFTAFEYKNCVSINISSSQRGAFPPIRHVLHRQAQAGASRFVHVHSGKLKTRKSYLLIIEQRPIKSSPMRHSSSDKVLVFPSILITQLQRTRHYDGSPAGTRRSTDWSN